MAIKWCIVPRIVIWTTDREYKVVVDETGEFLAECDSYDEACIARDEILAMIARIV